MQHDSYHGPFGGTFVIRREAPALHQPVDVSFSNPTSRWACFDKMDRKNGLSFSVDGFELGGRKPAEGGVDAVGIVEGSDGIENGGAGLFVGEEVAAVDEPHFEGAPNAFQGGVIVALGPAPDGREQIGLGQSCAEITSRVLNAAVGVEEQSRRWLAMRAGHFEGVEGEMGVDLLAHGPAGELPAAQIEDASEVKPTLPGFDVGNVGHPDGVGGCGFWSEVALKGWTEDWRAHGM